jgi:hypothetical protein
MVKDGVGEQISLGRFAQVIAKYHPTKNLSSDRGYFLLLAGMICYGILTSTGYTLREKVDQLLIDSIKFVMEQVKKNEPKETYEKKLEDIGKKFPISLDLFVKMYCATIP